jgi:cytochrome c553
MNVVTNSLGRIILILAALICTGLQSAQAEAHVDALNRKRAICAGCHGPAGTGVVTTAPNIAGQHAPYTNKQLSDFKTGARKSSVMNPIVAPLSSDEIGALATFYARQPRGQGGTPAALVELGEKIYRGGNPQNNVPACMACHGPSGTGNAPAGFPALSGQHADYTRAQLLAYKSGDRSNDRAAIMRSISSRMTDAEIEAVAAYVEGLY